MKHKEEDAFLTLQVKIERWLKKNRIKLAVLAGVVVAYFVVFGIWQVMENGRIEAANVALNALVQDPNNSSAKETLKAKAPELYDLFLLSVASKNSDIDALKQLENRAGIVGELAGYQLASLNNDFASFGQKEGAVLKDFAALQDGYLLLKSGQDGSNAFGKIAIDSELKSIANALEHYKAQ